MIYDTEQQKEIVRSESKYKLINGCAGSGKTETLIKCALTDLTKNKRPILFLTLVGSVTEEIKTRLETNLNIEIYKQGKSNHYVGHYNEIPICISNYDAWVHLMLEDFDGLDDIAECYSEKVDILMNKTQNEPLTCYMKNKHKVGLLLIDEAQDLRSSKMKILTNLSRTHVDLDIYCAGDYLQTLFSDDTSDLQSMDVHSMNVFKRISPTYFDLNICKRCPKAHVDFNNLILQDIQAKYMIPPMQSDNNNTVDKPVIFTHYKSSDNTNARITAEQVTNMIKILMSKDTSIVPDDIAIIMGKSKNNEIYFQLQDTLNKLYATLGYKDSLLYMSTYGDGTHNSLDWEKAKGKTKMLSIHGDKGRGHKVVFFLGLTENSIPRDIFIHKPSEIIPESLLNVGTTRSKQYLFIGFAYSYPSRYLHRKRHMLSKYAYCSWDTPDSIPEPYKSILLSQSILHPVWTCTYKKEKILTGNKSTLEVKGDISKGFEQTKNLVMHPWKKEEMQSIFGKNQTIQMPLQEEHYILIGLMSELLIQRLTNKENLFKLLHAAGNRENNIYTNDERLLSCMYDIKHSYSEGDLDKYLKKYTSFFEKNPDLVNDIQKAVTQKKNVVHSIFSSSNFMKDLHMFLSDTKNKDLNTESIWNVTLFHNQITQKIYRPAVNSCLGYFNEDISILHDNIDIYINEYIRKNTIVFEKQMNLAGRLSQGDMVALKKESTENDLISIVGRSDIYDSTNRHLYEIKASRLKGCSQEWLTQTITYTMMLDVYKMPVETISIVNVLNGSLWKWGVRSLPKIEDVVSTKISKKYEWHTLEVGALVRGIENMRKIL
jgi:thymidine kinase